jgi:hypothetical protein
LNALLHNRQEFSLLTFFLIINDHLVKGIFSAFFIGDSF